MSNKQRTNLVGLFTILSIVFTILQSAFSMGSPLSGQPLIIVSAIIMFINIAITAAKQYISKLILNQATETTMLALVVAIILGAVDLFDVFNFKESTSQWVRWGVTLVVTIINAISEYLYPSQLSEINKLQTWVVKDENGDYLTSYNNGGAIFGSLENAIEYDETQSKAVALAIGGGTVGTPKPPVKPQ